MLAVYIEVKLKTAEVCYHMKYSYLHAIFTIFIGFMNSFWTTARNFTPGNVLIDIFSLKTKQCLYRYIIFMLNMEWPHKYIL